MQDPKVRAPRNLLAVRTLSHKSGRVLTCLVGDVATSTYLYICRLYIYNLRSSVDQQVNRFLANQYL